MKLGRKICSALLIICLVAGLFPAAVFAENDQEQENNAQLNFGSKGIDDGDIIWMGSYGSYTNNNENKDNTSISWKVLDADQTNTNEPGMFLITEYLIGTGEKGSVYFQQKFHGHGPASGLMTPPFFKGAEHNENINETIAVAYQDSDAQQWCKNFAENNLSTMEQTSLIQTTKSDSAYTPQNPAGEGFQANTNILAGDIVFFLSAEEAENTIYFSDNTGRQTTYGGTPKGWWLRSGTSQMQQVAGWISSTGSVGKYPINSEFAARPACNLDLNKILLTSAAVGGKPTGTTGLSTVSEYTGRDWKLTLLDSERTFSANVNGQSSVSAKAGETVQISYSGAGTGDNEYVSVLLCDSNNNVLYYGHIAEKNASGIATLTIPAGLSEGNYTLNVFSEQCNGDYKTDYASAFTDISLTVDNTKPTLTAGNVSRTSHNAATVKFTSSEAGTYYYEIVDHGATQPTIDTSTNGTSCDITDQTISLTNLTEGAKDIYIVVKDAAGNTSTPLEVKIPEYTVAPAITTQPIDQTVTVGATATFSVVASGVPDPGYQWQVKKNSEDNWTDIDGATSASYTTEETMLEMNDYQYRCVVTNSVGSVTSNAVTLTVQSNDASVTAVTVNGTAGTINGTDITVVLPYGTESLPTDSNAVSITPATGASVSNLSTIDNGETWTFTVTAENGITQQTYTIHVSIAADPAAGNKADVAAAKSVIENHDWTVAQSTANTEDAVKTWIENELAGMTLNGVSYTVTVNNFTAATAGTSGDRDGANGSFAFTVVLSKGEDTGETATSTYASDTATITNGVITATAYVPPSTPSTPTTPSKPEQPSGPSTGDSDGWESILEEILDAEDGDTITIDMNGETEVPGEIFEAVADRDVTVIFEMGEDVSWTVNGNDVPKDTAFDTLNLGVTMNTSGIPIDVINAITGEVGTVQVTLEHDGAFGFVLTLTAPLGEENAGYWANLYHYNEADEGMDFETAAEIDDDGTVHLRMSHASQYAIVIDDHSHAPLPFTDVSADDWFYDPVAWAYNNGLMTGTSATTFEPNTSTTRGMIVAILHRLEGGPMASGGSFIDVTSGDWYADAVNWAASVGIVAGFEDGSFRPNDAITREQMAAILCNYAQWKGMDTSARVDLSGYSDQPSAWAQDVMEWAVGEGLISGTSATTLDPQGNATRAQVAAILQRFLAE